MKKLLYITIIISFLFSACVHHMSTKQKEESVSRQKKTINQNCVSYEGQKSVYADQNYLLDEPKSITEKNFANYIQSNYTGPKTGIVFYLVFQPNISPCCRQTVVVDTLKMDTKQVELLANVVLKYPIFNQIQFNKDEKIKYLSIMMAWHKKGELDVGFR